MSASVVYSLIGLLLFVEIEDGLSHSIVDDVVDEWRNRQGLHKKDKGGLFEQLLQ